MDTAEMSETGHVVGGELGCQVETGVSGGDWGWETLRGY